MQIQENYSLKRHHTFGTDVSARYFSSFNNLDELQELLAFNDSRKTSLMLLGGGSNILFRKDYDGLVLHNAISGIEELHEDEDYVYVKAGAGENWHSLVLYTLEKNWAGLENLSLIPGNVGASPMQNIGAYGVEVQDLFWSLEAFHLKDRKPQVFTNADCKFGYRESVFKGKLKNQFAILNVTYRLRKKPVFHTSYGAITQELERMQVKELSIQAISRAVINIRQSKLPDPAVIGNAGSFFKNPTVGVAVFESIRLKYPHIVGYPNADGSVKLAAGWLIEQCGWKGYREGDAGVHDRQALVLVNYGSATGTQVYDLSSRIVASVKKQFNVELEREVNII